LGYIIDAGATSDELSGIAGNPGILTLALD
jgi:hypothetical protein